MDPPPTFPLPSHLPFAKTTTLCGTKVYGIELEQLQRQCTESLVFLSYERGNQEKMNEKVQEGFGYRVKNTHGVTGVLLKTLYVEGTCSTLKISLP